MKDEARRCKLQAVNARHWLRREFSWQKLMSYEGVEGSLRKLFFDSAAGHRARERPAGVSGRVEPRRASECSSDKIAG